MSPSNAERPSLRSGIVVNRRNGAPSDQGRPRLTFLGLIEAAPLVVGGVFSVFTDSAVVAIVAAVLAFTVTAIICWCFRNRTPPTRIEFSGRRRSDGARDFAWQD